MKSGESTIDTLRAECAMLREHLGEAEETLRAIRNGEVDAVIVNGRKGEQIYTLTNAAEPYRVLVEEMNEGAATLTADGVILYCNHHFASLVQGPPEHVVGINLRWFVVPEEQELLTGLLRTAEKGRATGELTLRATAGGVLPVKIALSRLSTDSPAAMCALVTDLTERKNKETALLNLMEDLGESKTRLEAANRDLKHQIEETQRAEEALHVSLNRLRGMVDANIVGVLIATADGTVKEANDYYLRMIGYTREEFEEGKVNWRALTPPEWLSADENALRVLKETGRCAPYEKEYQRRDGTRISAYLADTMLPGPDQEIAAFAVDLTERKKAEAAVRQERQRFFDVLETLPTMICLLTPDYHVAFANRGFRDRFGEAKGRLCYEHCFGKSAPCEFCESFRVLQTGKPHRWEVHTPTGEIIDAFDVPFTDADGSRLVLEMDVDITEQRRAEQTIRELNATLEQRVLARTEELRQSEERFRAIAANTPDHVIVMDRDLRYTMVVNPQLGLTEAGMLGKTDYDILAKEDAERLTAIKREVLTTGRTVPLDMTLMAQTGECDYFEGAYVPKLDPVGRIDGLIGYIRNVTARKRAELALRESQERVELALQVARAFAFEWKIASDEVIRSPHCAEILGLVGDAVHDTGRDFFQRVHPEDREQFVETVTRLTPAAPKYAAEYRLVRPDGDVVVLQESGIATFGPDGKLSRLIGMTADVTARVTAEQSVARLNEALKRRMTELQTIFDTAPAGIAIAEDPLGNQIRGNPAIEKMLGLGAGAELSLSSPAKPAYRIIENGREVPPLELPMQRAARGEVVAGYLMNILRADSSTVLLHSCAAPLRDETGKVYGAVGVFLDITEIKRAELELRKMTDELKATNQELESFSYSISHDLRAPLRSIDGFSRILLRDCAELLDEKSRDNLQRVRQSSQRLGELIDDLLELSRTTRANLHKVDVDLSALARAALDDLQRGDPARQVNVVIEPELRVSADAVLLRSALDNLLGNAWKFTRGRTDARIEVGAVWRERERAFFVRDNGVGFDMTYAGKLFGAFQRLHSTREFPGTGIGLATVQRIVHRHGGRIWADAAVNAGATFYFTLGSPPSKP
ncbi:MAG TPA: PAS domain S-box protein [Opitutaceae bacterium]|nr:PAS domain S-box protein [Opitutaceae bacterium]